MYMRNKTIQVLLKQMVTSASATCMVALAAAFSTCIQWMCFFRGFPDTFDCEVIFRRHSTRTLGTRNIRLEKYNWATSRENLGTHVCIFICLWEFCVQVRLKPACIATEAWKSLEILDTASTCIYIILHLSKHGTTNMLIRLRGCAG